MARVLVIDDDEIIRNALARILATAGHETVDAVNGRDGIDALIRARFDVVITDLVMPEQGGIETIQRVRELDPTIPIIAISGAFGDETGAALDGARQVGANLSIEKPFRVEVLLSAVADAISGRAVN